MSGDGFVHFQKKFAATYFGRGERKNGNSLAVSMRKMTEKTQFAQIDPMLSDRGLRSCTLTQRSRNIYGTMSSRRAFNILFFARRRNDDFVSKFAFSAFAADFDVWLVFLG